MKQLLPVVNSDVGHAIAGSLGDEFNKETWRAEFKRIQKLNPAIAEFIGKWSRLAKAGNKLHTVICGIVLYKLLESQAEVDMMEEEFNLG